MIYFKNTLLLFGLIAFSFHSNAQFSKSFYYKDSPMVRSQNHFEKLPDSEFIYSAGMRKKTSNPAYTIISAMDEKGQLKWHQTISHPTVTIPVNSGVMDVKANDSHLFVASFLSVFPIEETNLNLYKLDLDGTIIDSVNVHKPTGLDRFQTEMDFDADGNLFFIVKDRSAQIYFIRIHTETMSIISEERIDNSLFNTFLTRKGHAQFVDGHAYIAFNDPGMIQFHKIDGTGTVVDSFQVTSPSGDLSDFELNNVGNLSLLITKTTPTDPADNPIRIIEINTSGGFIADNSYPVNNANSFTDFTIDNSSGDIYVSASKSAPGNYRNGAIVKIESDAIAWEQLFPFSVFYEIEFVNNSYYSAGINSDQAAGCDFGLEGEKGLFLLSEKKNQIPSGEIVGPHARFEMGDYSGYISANVNNFIRGGTTSQTYGHQEQGNLIYSSTLLLTGKDEANQIHGANAAYSSVFTVGPITNEADFDQVEEDKWQRVWKISKAQVDAHITAFTDGDPTYIIPEVIRNWPGNGDTEKGQQPQLAHYQDLNNNGTYDPQEGEYPLIKGDFTILSIYNDLPEYVGSSCVLAADKIGVQVFEYFYGFYCSMDDALANSTFLYYEVINYSDNDYDEFSIGHHLDMDVVNSDQNYIYSDPVRGIMYQTYQGVEESPEQAYLILGSSSISDGMDNAIGIGANESPNGFGYGDGITDNERLGMTSFIANNIDSGPTGSPSDKFDYHNYLNAIWLDGTHLNYGGNGYSEGGINTTFSYPGDSDAIFYTTNGVDPGAPWSEETVGTPAGDRRGITASGPFILNAADTLEFDISYVTGLVNDETTSHASMLSNVDGVKSYFTTNETPCEGNFDFYTPREEAFPTIGGNESSKSAILLYPNPANNTINLKGIPANATIVIRSISGQVLNTVRNQQNTLTLDVTAIPSGIYIVSVIGETTTYIKFVKE